MKVKIRHLVESLDALRALGAMKLPASKAMRVSRVLGECDSHLKVFSTAVSALKDGESVNELLEEEVSLTCDKFPVDMLGDQEIAIGHLQQLGWLID